MVIFVAGQRSEKQRVRRRLHGLALLLAMLTGTSGAGAAASLNRPGPGMTFPSSHVEADRTFENRLFDPAAAEFNSLLSYGAMSLIAPTIFGDFQSPTDASLPSISGSSGFIRANSGLDPVAANAINTIIQPDLMVNVTALLADAIDVVGPNSEAAAIAGEATAPTPNDGGVGEHDSYGAPGPSAAKRLGVELRNRASAVAPDRRRVLESSGRGSSGSIPEGRVRRRRRWRPAEPGAEPRSD